MKTVPVVYDTGALLAGERHDTEMIAQHSELKELGIEPIVPAVVLAQAWRGGPQRHLTQMLLACDIRPDSEQIARTAGVACGRAGTTDVVDAIVVVTAAAEGARVVTSDSRDLKRLADALGVKVQLRVI